MIRSLAALPLALLCAAPAPQEPKPWRSWKELTSNAGHYRVRYKLDQDPPPRGELTGLAVYVLDAAGKELRPKLKLLADADMPEHGHGLSRLPEVAAQPDGGFKVSGLRLHMPGKWQVYLDLVEGAHTERAQFDLALE
jgi:hypothetical protein